MIEIRAVIVRRPKKSNFPSQKYRKLKRTYILSITEEKSFTGETSEKIRLKEAGKRKPIHPKEDPDDINKVRTGLIQFCKDPWAGNYVHFTSLFVYRIKEINGFSPEDYREADFKDMVFDGFL